MSLLDNLQPRNKNVVTAKNLSRATIPHKIISASDRFGASDNTEDDKTCECAWIIQQVGNKTICYCVDEIENNNEIEKKINQEFIKAKLDPRIFRVNFYKLTQNQIEDAYDNVEFRSPYELAENFNLKIK